MEKIFPENEELSQIEQEVIRVIVVEDETSVTLHLTALLKKNNYNILKVFRSGEEFLESIHDLKPDVILMDVFLGGKLNGIETVKLLKDNYKFPVVYMTSSIEYDILNNAKYTLPDGFLRKPFSENQLLATLELSVFRNKMIKKELKNLEDQKKFHEMNIAELSETNSHLIAATWRERDIKKKLADTIQELNKTKILLEAQNKRVAESINYSRRIQMAINTNEESLLAGFRDAFIFYKPKDVISGDFPWMTKNEKGEIYLAAVDCTGHGVPGAMLSMIGNLLLNDIVHSNREAEPEKILMELHRQIVSTLKQDLPESNSNDGMDMAMIKVEPKRKHLVFSGAHRPLLHLRNGNLEQFGGDKFPVGGIQYKGKNTYSSIKIELQAGDKIFLFSDGIVDQIGGNDGKKWMIAGLKQFILDHQKYELKKFKAELENTFYSHKKDYKQIDDLLVIGIEI